jgi:3-isopropylmalate dehydrogenase
MSKRIAVLPGDGIGPEVVADAIATFPSDWELVEIDAGARRYRRTGELLSPADIEAIKNSDALLFGAIGDPSVGDGILERGILLRLRKDLDLYANLRPVPELGIVFVRENTEGLYAGVGHRAEFRATETSVNTVAAVERCVQYAFSLAEQRSGHLTLVHKTNVLVYAGALWREVTERVARLHPQVTLGYEHVDAAAYHLVTNPERFDVIVTDNMFGDILSDLAAGLAGGLGRAASANLHPDPATRPQRCMGLFEPVHGSAPDIAGRGVADSTGAVRAAQLMFKTLAGSSDLTSEYSIEQRKAEVSL